MLKKYFLKSACLAFLYLAQGQTHAATMLVYGPTSGGFADATPGFTVTVWSAAVWATKTTADFAAFDVIVFGDRDTNGWPCFSSTTVWDAAVANAAVWGPAVTGNKVVIGSDPDFHSKTAIIQQLVNFAAGDSLPGPGLYVSLSCVYSNFAPVPVNLLSYFGSFTASDGSGNNAHIVAASPALTGITDAMLSNWSQSVHEGFNSWPATWQPLAIVRDAATAPYHAGDGTDGLPYIMAEGASLFPITTGTPTPTLTMTPTISDTPTISETPSISPTFSYSPTATPSLTFSPSPTITPTMTATPPTLKLHLYPSSPNPSHGEGTWISFWISTPANVEIIVYTVAGEEVERLKPVFYNEGNSEELWDNKNQSGKGVASGVYVFKLVARSLRDETLSDYGKCAVLR